MQKFLKNNLKIIIVVIITAIIISGITTVFAYSLMANSVGFTPKDSSWDVKNVEAAVNDLYYKTPGVPTGTILSVMKTHVPYGYLACDGSTYNISDYMKLATSIKYDFGSYNYFGGDGETTFAVPDLRGEFLRGTGTNNTTLLSGGEVGIHSDQGLPNITGNFEEINHIVRVKGSGAFSVSTENEYSGTSSGGNFGNRGPVSYTFNASKSNSIYGKSTDVRPTNTSVLYIIKY